MTLLCARGFFAEEGQPCDACPPGGVCDGGAMLPYSMPGWYQVGLQSFEACAPAGACAGGVGSPCAVGYIDDRCKNCAFKYYRLQDGCVACPSFTLLYVIIFLLLVCIIVICAYWLNKKRVNLVGCRLPRCAASRREAEGPVRRLR